MVQSVPSTLGFQSNRGLISFKYRYWHSGCNVFDRHDRAGLRNPSRAESWEQGAGVN